MLGPPVDAWYVNLGLAAAGLAAFGIAVGVPTAPPPAATPVATAVDTVAATDHPTTAVRSTTADEARIGPRRVALRTAGGTASATLAYGPVTPVSTGSKLDRVLAGAPPERVFSDPSAFRRALERARNRSPSWRPVETIRVRGVSWGEIDATLVG